MALRASLTLPIALVLSACQFGAASGPPSDTVAQAVTGLSESQLTACAGQPDRVQDTAGARTLIYESTTPGAYPEEVRLGVRQQSLGGDLARDSYRSGYCQAEVTVRDGRVLAVVYRGSSSWRTGYEACSARLANCLARTDLRDQR